jgi:glycosyltransferase involved in cell wall biosynthesis
MRNELISLGIPQEKIDVLPNGININQFYPLGEKEENLVLFVGRVCREKGIFTLLKAISSLKTSVKLAIIGPQNCDQQQFDNMLELIKKENEKGKHRITYLGAKNREEIIEWYRKASLLVLPSQREGLPMVILESLACETPVVATSVGGIPEIFSHNECGILVPPNSPLKLAEAIQFLLDNKDIRTKFGKKGRIMVIEKYSMDKVVEKLCKIYNEAISNFYS